MVTEARSQEPNVEVVEFRRRYAKYFRQFNYEWLEKYFEVEPYDKIVLNDPRRNIIKLGGRILFAKVAGEVVGTCALLKHSDTMYELAKLAVPERCQGRGIGRRLIESAIARARTLGAKTLILATSDLLTAANRLYESMGFEYVDTSVIGPLPYKRETVVMAKRLEE